MSRAAGHDRVAALVAAGELDRVAADPVLARRLLSDAVKHVGSAQSASGLGDLTGAYEYPDSDEAGPDEADVDDAVAVALSAVTAAGALLDSGRLGPWE